MPRTSSPAIFSIKQHGPLIFYNWFFLLFHMFPLSIVKAVVPRTVGPASYQGLTNGKAETEGWVVLSLPQSDQWSGVSPQWHLQDPPWVISCSTRAIFNLRFFATCFSFLVFIALLYTIFSIFCNIYLAFCKKYFDPRVHQKKKAWFPRLS